VHTQHIGFGWQWRDRRGKGPSDSPLFLFLSLLIVEKVKLTEWIGGQCTHDPGPVE